MRISRVIIALLSSLVSVSFSSPAFAEVCPTRQSLAEKQAMYARVVNLGASFTHGCTTCDEAADLRNYMAQENDHYWIRRSPLVRFFSERILENASSEVFVFENDQSHNLSYLVDENTIKTNGYTGLWHFNSAEDRVQLAQGGLEQKILRDSVFINEAKKIAPIYRRKDYPLYKTQNSGIVYQFATRNPQGEKLSVTVFDLAIDGARRHDIFRTFGDENLYRYLDGEKIEWNDPTARKMLIAKTVKKIRDLQPTVLLALDALFWDGVTDTIDEFYESRSAESTIAYLLMPMIWKVNVGKDAFSREKRWRIREDYYSVLEYLVSGKSFNPQSPTIYPKIPIIIAKLAHSPAAIFAQGQRAQKFGSLVGSSIATRTGKDFSSDITHWLQQKPSWELASNDFERLDPITSAIANAAIENGLPDIPKFLYFMDKSFQESNRYLEAFRTKVSGNPFHVVDSTEFFETVPELLNANAMHPSSKGSQMLSREFAGWLCQ